MKPGNLHLQGAKSGGSESKDEEITKNQRAAGRGRVFCRLALGKKGRNDNGKKIFYFGIGDGGASR